jgi:hypothetical protein
MRRLDDGTIFKREETRAAALPYRFVSESVYKPGQSW